MNPNENSEEIFKKLRNNCMEIWIHTLLLFFFLVIRNLLFYLRLMENSAYAPEYVKVKGGYLVNFHRKLFERDFEVNYE